MNDLAERAEIKRYVEKAFLAKIMQMNDLRRERQGYLHASLAAKGHTRNSSACMLGELDVEEVCVAELLHQMADMYIEAYERKGMKIGPEVLKHIAEAQMHVVGGRQSSLMGQAQLKAVRMNSAGNHAMYGRFGNKAPQTLKELETKIDLYNLTPKKAEPITVTNISYHLVNSRVTHGDDNSINIVNEKELFDGLAAAITSAVSDAAERTEILARLGELKSQKTKTDYLAMVPTFIKAAASIGHVIGPYLPALIEKAEALL